MANRRSSRRASVGSISREEAHNALTFLVHQGRLAASAVERALRDREKILQELRQRLAELGGDGPLLGLSRRAAKDGPFPTSARVSRKNPGPKPAARRKKPVPPALRKSRQTHGKYLGSIRQLSKADRKKIKAIREQSGVNAAIRAAKSRLAERRFIAGKSASTAGTKASTGKRRGAAGRGYPARPQPRPDRHGSSGAGREQGGSGPGREHE